MQREKARLSEWIKVLYKNLHFTYQDIDKFKNLKKIGKGVYVKMNNKKAKVTALLLSDKVDFRANTFSWIK